MSTRSRFARPSCLLVLALCLMQVSMSMRSARAAAADAVGFIATHSPDGTEIGIWYPARGEMRHLVLGPYAQDVAPGAPPVAAPGSHVLPLVVISHGQGGSFTGHLDTAMALARAGFVVAALTHPGDNWRDSSRATDLAARPAALSALITWMLTASPCAGIIDARRIGAFGFSSGGFTVLAAAGGRPDLTKVGPHCAAHPGFYDCALLAAHPPVAGARTFTRDGRIRAIVVAAPALGFTFDRAGLAGITVPVQLWRAGNDKVLPAPFYADAVHAALPPGVAFHDVPGAGHFDFLAPCTAEAASLPICTSAPGFDRAAFHRDFDAAVVAFFRHTLD